MKARGMLFPSLVAVIVVAVVVVLPWFFGEDPPGGDEMADSSRGTAVGAEGTEPPTPAEATDQPEEEGLRVQGDTGRPLGGVRLEFYGRGATLGAGTTDERGRCPAPAATGSTEVTCIARHGAFAGGGRLLTGLEDVITLGDGYRARIRLETRRPGANPQPELRYELWWTPDLGIGEAASRARIGGRALPCPRDWGDPKGPAFEGLGPGWYTVDVIGQDVFGRATFRIRTSDVEVSLRFDRFERIRISGRVVCQRTGEPIAGAEMIPTHGRVEPERLPSILSAVRSDSAGAFEIVTISAFARLCVRAKGYAGRFVDTYGESRENLTVKLRAGRSLEVTLVGRDGAGIELALVRNRDSGATGMTDLAGRVVLEGVPERSTRTVLIEGAGEHLVTSQLAVPADENAVSVGPDEWARVRVRHEWMPVEGSVTVRIQSAVPEQRSSAHMLDSADAWVPGIGTGPCRVTVIVVCPTAKGSEGFAMTLENVHIGDAERVIDFHLPSTCLIVRALGLGGRRISGRSVTISPIFDDSLKLTYQDPVGREVRIRPAPLVLETDGSGECALVGAPVGSYSVTVEGSETIRIQVREGRPGMVAEVLLE